MSYKVLKEDIFSHPEKFDRVRFGDSVDFLYGYDLVAEITEDDIEHLRNGGVLRCGDYEYSHFLRMRPN